MTSPRLCGGMLVAMPTAMPPAPLTSRFGNFAGRTVGSLARAVVVRLEIDGVLVDVVEQMQRDLGQARFGVAHRRRRIAVDRAEIALAVDQRHAHGEILRHAHQRVVDRLVAVRVILAHDVADDARPTSCTSCPACSRSRASSRGCGDAPASSRRAHRAARAPRSRSWRNRGRSASSRRGWRRGEYRRAPAARRGCYFQGQTKGNSGQFSAENHIAHRGPNNHPEAGWRGRFSARFFMDLRADRGRPS